MLKILIIKIIPYLLIKTKNIKSMIPNTIYINRETFYEMREHSGMSYIVGRAPLQIWQSSRLYFNRQTK